ncbi:UDP-xylose transporter 1 [Sesamum alatum]|uniref:UDP-xylose transporter 1 n=1 Tax=Sesamum alatum TaxID=300844 RepID=A0AAE1Z3G1_9LAMI|nr:UDP-xylose transporter 1 [Sesamum alatum]
MKELPLLIIAVKDKTNKQTMLAPTICYSSIHQINSTPYIPLPPPPPSLLSSATSSDHRQSIRRHYFKIFLEEKGLFFVEVSSEGLSLAPLRIAFVHKMGEMSGFQLGVIGALFLSVASSVSIVICNKALMSNLGFPFATTLTSWHLMVTYCSLHVALRLNFFENKAIDMKTVILFGILNGVSIGFLNLSLGFNSIGFYQMTKLAIIPFTVLLETLFLKKQFSQNIKLSLSVLLLGVGIASVTDLQLNFVGTILSLLAIITTCVGQILTNTIQKRLNVTSTQLLYQSAPFQAAVLFVSGPFLDQCLTKQNVFAYKYSPVVLGFIVLSCLIAVFVNFSTFLVIGKTSPVTYQVLGHLKTCLVLAFGYTLLHDPFTTRNIIGILIAIVGMGLYSYFCTNETKRKQDGHISSLSQIKERDSTPLLVSHQDKESKDSVV